jgi:hypothetical protein
MAAGPKKTPSPHLTFTPEPATMALLGLGALRRRRKRR